MARFLRRLARLADPAPLPGEVDRARAAGLRAENLTSNDRIMIGQLRLAVGEMPEGAAQNARALSDALRLAQHGERDLTIAIDLLVILDFARQVEELTGYAAHPITASAGAWRLLVDALGVAVVDLTEVDMIP